MYVKGQTYTVFSSDETKSILFPLVFDVRIIKYWGLILLPLASISSQSTIGSNAPAGSRWTAAPTAKLWTS